MSKIDLFARKTGHSLVHPPISLAEKRFKQVFYVATHPILYELAFFSNCSQPETELLHSQLFGRLTAAIRKYLPTE